MKFEIIGDISNIETIAVSSSIRDLQELRELYGGRRWRKLKGEATIRTENGDIRYVEIHWYECHGIGKRQMKVKRVIRR